MMGIRRRAHVRARQGALASAAVGGMGTSAWSARRSPRIALAERLRPYRTPALVGVLLAGLILAAVRVEIIRLRYDLANSLTQVTELGKARRELAARTRRLHDPKQLAVQARELGLVPPERVIELPPQRVSTPKP